MLFRSDHLTRGAELATGEVVAFIDDDAVAEPDWIAEHVRVYAQTDAVATAGPVLPVWLETEPNWFPAEFSWLVGCTEPGFAADGEEIRNGYGSNVSYRREVFLDVGGYDVHTGRKGDQHIQAHEAPVGIQIRDAYGQGVVYVEDAVVHHTLFAYRGEFLWLVSRSFWQGYSKTILEALYGAATDRASVRKPACRGVDLEPPWERCWRTSSETPVGAHQHPQLHAGGRCGLSGRTHPPAGALRFSRIPCRAEFACERIKIDGDVTTPLGTWDA